MNRFQASITSYVLESECDLRDPKWSSEAAAEAAVVLSSPDNGSGLAVLQFLLEWVENAGCATDFELRYLGSHPLV